MQNIFHMEKLSTEYASLILLKERIGNEYVIGVWKMEVQLLAISLVC
jgi:hypothetical protein